MKKAISALLLCTGISVGVSQEIIRLQDIETIKNSKIIVGLPGEPELDENLKRAAKSAWTMTPIVEYLPEKEAIAKAKADESYVVLKLREKRSYSSKKEVAFSNEAYRNISIGQVIEIRGKRANSFASTYIPLYEDDLTSPEILQFGIASLQYTLQLMDEKKMNNNLTIKKAYKEKSAEIKDKTILIPELWLSSKLELRDVKSLYNGNIKVVSYEEWSNAILEKDEAIAYLMIVPIPTRGEFTFYHYLMNPVNGQVYGVAYPKVAVSIGGFNVSASNSEFVTEKMLQMYNDIPTGEW